MRKGITIVAAAVVVLGGLFGMQPAFGHEPPPPDEPNCTHGHQESPADEHGVEHHPEEGDQYAGIYANDGAPVSADAAGTLLRVDQAWIEVKDGHLAPIVVEAGLFTSQGGLTFCTDYTVEDLQNELPQE